MSRVALTAAQRKPPAHSGAYYNAVREKRDILRSIYGGMMTLADLTKELWYSSRKSAAKWVESVELDGTRVGKSVRYDTDLVARKLVDGRGFV